MLNLAVYSLALYVCVPMYELCNKTTQARTLVPSWGGGELHWAELLYIYFARNSMFKMVIVSSIKWTFSFLQ